MRGTFHGHKEEYWKETFPCFINFSEKLKFLVTSTSGSPYWIPVMNEKITPSTWFVKLFSKLWRPNITYVKYEYLGIIVDWQGEFWSLGVNVSASSLLLPTYIEARSMGDAHLQIPHITKLDFVSSFSNRLLVCVCVIYVLLFLPLCQGQSTYIGSFPVCFSS